jgi:hypothetical protein
MKIRLTRANAPDSFVLQIDCVDGVGSNDDIDRLPCSLLALRWCLFGTVCVFGIGGVVASVMYLEAMLELTS